MFDNLHQRVDLDSEENHKIYGTQVASINPNREIGALEKARIAAKEKAYTEQIGRTVPRYDAPCNVLTAAQMHDSVNSPSHYTDGGIETIDFIEAKKLNYNLGNVIKYVTRAGKKHSASAMYVNYTTGQDLKQIEDLEKAAWYLAREIKTLKGK